MKRSILQKDFFDRTMLSVAKELLGKYIVRSANGYGKAWMITEVEVYDGYKDRASHARNGMMKRNAIMYGEPGVFYVYGVRYA